MITFLIFSGLVLLSFIILHNNRVQTFLVEKISSKFSERLDTQIEISSVDFEFFNKLVLNDLVIEDRNSDTLVYIEKLSGKLASWKRKARVLTFDKVFIESARMNLYQTDSAKYNYDFIFEALKKKDSLSSELDIRCNDFAIANSVISHKSSDWSDYNKICLNNLDIYDLNVELNDLNFSGDTISLNIIKLDLKERSGFVLNDFSAEIVNQPGEIFLSNIFLRTPETDINSEYITLKIPVSGNMENSRDSFKFLSHFNSVNIKISDLDYFIETESPVNQTVKFNGNINGNLSAIEFKEFTLNLGSCTSSSGDFKISGLSDLNSAIFDMNFDNLVTDINDIKQLLASVLPDTVVVKFPEELRNAGQVYFNGKMSGSIGNFKTTGDFMSDLGDLTINIEVINDEVAGLTFFGQMQSDGFNLGKFLGDTVALGLVSFTADINGNKNKDEGINAMMNGMVTHLYLNGYYYQNLQITGDLAQNRFDGSFRLDDPNLNLDFLGRIDFSGELPEFDFSAKLTNAIPAELHLAAKNTGIDSFDMLIEANFQGLTLDELKGELVIANSVFRSANDEVRIDDFSFTSGSENNRNKILLISDFADARMIGKYNFSGLVNSLRNYIYEYLPSVAESKSLVERNSDNDFSFNVQFKDTEKISKLFFPDLQIHNNTIISGHYNSFSGDLSLDCNSPGIIYNGKILDDMYINISTENNVSKLKLGAGSLALNKKMKLKNIEFNTLAKNDSLFLTAFWDNKDIKKNSGSISAIAGLARNQDNTHTVVSLHTAESELYYSDTLWQMAENLIQIDSTSISISNFSIENQNQMFAVNGKISEFDTDTLFFEFRDFGISNINPMFKKEKIKFFGKLSGDAKLFNFYNSPLFYSDASIDDLILNGEYLGDGWLKSDWDPIHKLIHISSSAQNDESETFNIDGYINPDSHSLDFDIIIDKLRLNVLNPFINNTFSGIRGAASGVLSLKGKSKDPKLNGRLNIQNASFVLDYLQCRYSVHESSAHNNYNLEIVNNNFVIDSIELRDKDRNKAIVNGIIKNDRFIDFDIDLNINTSKFLCIDTNQKDNKDFFGKVYATGTVGISGSLKNIKIDVDASADSKSRIVIPLDHGKVVKENDFITFIDPNAEDDEDEEEESGTNRTLIKRANTSLQVNLDLEVTPDAEIVIWFSSSGGDVLKAQGSGNFTLDVDNEGKLKMYGDYLIERGDYRFTLQNIHIKEFNIQHGSTISWDGNPVEANINIDAMYRIRTTLYDFLLDESNADYTKRIPVETHLLLTGNLLSPEMDFSIQVPTTIDDLARSQLETLSEAELHKQVISLLVIGRFQPMEGRNSLTDLNPSSYSGTGISTATELLTSQLNFWITQISTDFDLGVNYRTGDELTNDEMEVALSTQLLDNRMNININGNVDMGGENNPTRNNIVGDFDVDYKMNRKGKFRIKAYSHANDNLIYDTAPYTQGIGILYREEFSSFKELVKNTWRKVFPKRLEEKQ